MLKLKLQYFGHVMQRVNSLEKTLVLGKIEGKRRRGQQRMKWLDGIIDSMDLSLSKLGRRGWWRTCKPGCCSPWITKSQTQLATEQQLYITRSGIPFIILQSDSGYPLSSFSHTNHNSNQSLSDYFMSVFPTRYCLSVASRAILITQKHITKLFELTVFLNELFINCVSLLQLKFIRGFSASQSKQSKL